MINFSEIEIQLTETHIMKLERKLSFKFPDEYKNHLLKFNGGRCEPNIFNFEENGVLTKSFVDYFLAVYDGEYDNLETYFKIYKVDKKRMPDTFFPIAHDPGGNLICINKLNNKVYFWDHEYEIDYSQSDDNDRSNLYFIDDSLYDFIYNLK